MYIIPNGRYKYLKKQKFFFYTAELKSAKEGTVSSLRERCHIQMILGIQKLKPIFKKSYKAQDWAK